MATTDAKKYVLITGANTGIGWEAAKALLQSPRTYHIWLGSRSVEKGEQAVATLQADVPETRSTVEVLQVDVESDASIQKAFDQVSQDVGYLDVLVNNAGQSLDHRIDGDMTMREAWNKTYDINVAGTQVMTHTFAPLLLRSADPRLLFVTSGLSSLAWAARTYGSPYAEPRPVPAGWPKPREGLPPDAYRTSKAALNMLMLTWHWKLREDGVKVWCLSPGMLATGLGGQPEKLVAMGAKPASIGGQAIRAVVEGHKDHEIGKVVAEHDPSGVQPF